MSEQLAIDVPHKSHNKLAIIFGVALFLILLVLLFYRLDRWPAVWWDEGWTLDAARNWVVDGHLGHYLDGVPIPPRIPVRFPVVVPVALSMKVLGVGTWQGRLPEVITTLLSLGLLVYLSSMMFSKKTAIAAVVLLLILSVYGFHPLNIGRQVMAEMPMIFYLLAGYTGLWLALTRSPFWGVGAALLFGVAFHAKLQVPPFWLVSMALAILVSIIHKQKSTTKLILAIAIGSIAAAASIYLIQNTLMPGSFNEPALLVLLFNSVIFVADKTVRSQVLIQILLFGSPIFLGYLWSGWQILKASRSDRSRVIHQSTETELNRLILQSALWGLGASWFTWYTLMSIHTIRYFFPPFFIGCIFTSAYLEALTNGFDTRLFVRRISALFLKLDFKFANIQSLILFLALTISLTSAIKTDQIGLSIPGFDPVLAANYLRDNIPPGARVESFESELFFLAPQVKFHFPSDLVSMQAQRKTSIDPQFPIDYDPLEAHPDYLVIGYMGSLWPLYNDAIDVGLAHLEAEIGGYRVYHFQTTPNSADNN